jgi:hypothetical protein
LVEQQIPLARVRAAYKETAKHEAQPEITVEGHLGLDGTELSELVTQVVTAMLNGYKQIDDALRPKEQPKQELKEQLAASLEAAEPAAPAARPEPQEVPSRVAAAPPPPLDPAEVKEVLVLFDSSHADKSPTAWTRGVVQGSPINFRTDGEEPTAAAGYHAHPGQTFDIATEEKAKNLKVMKHTRPGCKDCSNDIFGGDED